MPLSFCRPFVLVVLAILPGVRIVHAQQHARQDPVVLDYADSLKSAKVDSEEVRHFLGHVKVHQGNVQISCDQAVHNLKTNLVEMNGSVRILQDTLLITAPHAVYDAKTKIARADGNVRLSDRVALLTATNGTYNTDTHVAEFHEHVKIVNDTATITANDLNYDRNTERSIATGNVTIVDSSAVITCGVLRNDRVTQQSWCSGAVRVRGRQDPSQLFGDSMYQDSRKGYTNVPRNPFLAHVDSTRPDSASPWKYDTMFIVSHTMEAFRSNQETYMAHDSVRLLRGDMQARCSEGKFFRSEDRIILSRSPVLWYHDTQLTGDSIAITLFQNKLQRLTCENSAFAIVRRDSLHPMRFDQLTGSRLAMRFSDDSLRSIRVEKNAQSVYFGYEEGKARGANRASGDTIEIKLAHGKPDKVYTMGGGEGQFWPEKLVKKNELDFRLNGFENREAERPKRNDFVMPGSSGK